MVTRADLHHLVDELDERQLAAAAALLARLRADELPEVLTDAPEDDEDETPEDTATTREGIEAIARGNVVPWEQFKANLRRRR